MLTDKIKGLLKYAHVTHKSVAAEMGISQVYFSKKVQNNKFSLNDFLKIADICDAKVYLITNDKKFKMELSIDDIKEETV